MSHYNDLLFRNGQMKHIIVMIAVLFSV